MGTGRVQWAGKGALQDVVHQGSGDCLPAVWARWSVSICHVRIAGKPESESADGGEDAVGRGRRQLYRMVVCTGAVPLGGGRAMSHHVLVL